MNSGVNTLNPKIEKYLSDLTRELSQLNQIEREELIREIRSHIQSSLDESTGTNPEENTEAVLQRFGTAQELAQRFLAESGATRQKNVSQILKEGGRARVLVENPEQPWPGLFGIVKDSATWRGLVYALLLFPLGIFYFSYATTGFALSVGLLILIIGFLIAACFLAGSSLLGRSQLGLMQFFLDLKVRIEEPELPAKGLMGFVKQHVFSTLAWKRMGYLFLSLPLGTFYFTVLVALLSGSLGLTFGCLLNLLGVNHLFLPHNAVNIHWNWSPIYNTDSPFMYGVVWNLFGIALGISAFFLAFHFVRLIVAVERRLGQYLLADL